MNIINLFEFGCKAYKKVFQDLLTNSLREFSELSPEYEPIANCMVETIKIGSIKISELPDKDDDLLTSIIDKVKNSNHFKDFCDLSLYTDEKLKEGLIKFFTIFENHITRDQKLFNRLQLEYGRKFLETGKNTKEGFEEIKSSVTTQSSKIDQILVAVSSNENFKGKVHFARADYKSRYLNSLFAYGYELLNNRKFRKALKVFKEFITEKESKKHEKYFAALTNIAVSYLNLKDYKRAFQYANKAHQTAPRRYISLVNLATACFYLHRLGQALEYAEKARERRTNNPNVYNILSIIYAEKGDQGKAKNLINKAIKISKRFAPAYVNRAIIHTQKQEFGKAFHDLSIAVALEPQNGEYFVNLGVTYQKKLFSLIQTQIVSLGTKGDIHYIDYERLDKLSNEEIELLEKATQYYEKALKLGVKIQDNLTLGVNLADCYQMKKKYKEADKIYKQIRVKDERDYPYQGSGDMYFWTSRFKKALSCYRKLIALHGDNPHAYNWIARTLKELKDLDGTIRNLQKAIQLDPENPMYKFNLGLTYEMSNRLQEAQRIFENLKQNGFYSGSVCYHLGWIYFSQEMYANAKLAFLEAKKSGIPRELFSEYLAVSAAAVKETEIAKEEFEYLLSLKPDNYVYNFDYARLLDVEGLTGEAKPYYIKALTSTEIKKPPKLSLWIARRLYEIDRAKTRIIIPRIGL